MTNTKKTDEFTGPGSAYQVIEQYKKNELDKSGAPAVCIKPDPLEKKTKSIN